MRRPRGTGQQAILAGDNPQWSDTKVNNRFKNFHDVTTEVRGVFQFKRPADHTAADAILKRIESRHERRNGFFHSTRLLDLNLFSRDCVEAFCDLLDYGALLFPTDWTGAVAIAGNMETCEAMTRLDRKSYDDPSLGPKVNVVFAKWRSLGIKPKTLGCEVAHHAEDMHLRLAIRNGGASLRDKLRALL